MIWKIGQTISCFFLPSWLAFSASFILFPNSSSVSSMSSKPSGGGLRLFDVLSAGMFSSVVLLIIQGTNDYFVARLFAIQSLGLMLYPNHNLRDCDFDNSNASTCCCILLSLHREQSATMINPTYLAQRTRSSTSWQDAKQRVLMSYREWIRAVC